jgi:hypothetical protein
MQILPDVIIQYAKYEIRYLELLMLFFSQCYQIGQVPIDITLIRLSGFSTLGTQQICKVFTKFYIGLKQA